MPSVPECLHRAAEELDGSLIWGDTREGHNFWQGVFHHLRDIADEEFLDDMETPESLMQLDRRGGGGLVWVYHVVLDIMRGRLSYTRVPETGVRYSEVTQALVHIITHPDEDNGRRRRRPRRGRKPGKLVGMYE